MSLQDRLYRALLLILPSSFRHDAAEDMMQLFRDLRRDADGRPLRLVQLWMASIADVVAHGVALRLASLRRPRLNFTRTTIMRAFAIDFRHGLRLLRRQPATAALAVVTLALGIGANTAIFSVVDPVLIRSLPYPEPDRVAMVLEKRPRENAFTNPVSPADYLDWRRMNTVFEHMAAMTEASVTLTGDGEPVQIDSALVGWSFFDLLRVAPEHGRRFVPADEVFGQHRKVIISHGFWLRRFGGASDAIGRKLTLNSGPNPWEVVGVLPADFTFIADYDLYLPLLLEVPDQPPPTRVSHSLEVYARLKPGVSMKQADDAMDRLGQDLEVQYPTENPGHGSRVIPMRDRYVGPIRDRLVVLSAAVGLVLLIACVNVASLLLARAASRRREMAVRSALGASRRRLVVQSLTESLSLSMLGGVAGVGLGLAMMKALPAVMPDRLSVIGVSDLALDFRILGFAFALAVVTGVLFGLLPAWQASKPTPADALASTGRGPAGIRSRSRVALVVGEVALASLTLVGAGLVVRSFLVTISQPIGFESEGRLTTAVSVPAARYPTPDARRLALEDIERRLAGIAGVTRVGAIDILPLSGGNSRMGFTIEGREPVANEPPIRIHPRVVTTGYFSTVGIPVKSGRVFTDADVATGEGVVVINEAARRVYWPDSDPVGAVVRYGDYTVPRRVIGVVGDVRHWGFTTEVLPMLYWPQSQASRGSLTFIVRSALGEDAIREAARGAVTGFDANIPLSNMRMLDEVVSRSLRAERAQAVLMGAFAVLALLLAVVGIYGVTAHVVAARVPEIGLRMTLGARPHDVIRQILAEGVRLALVGLVIGLLAGVYLMKLGAAVLFQVSPWDPVTLGGVAAVLLVAAVAACLVPAVRAVRVDPVEALRQG